MREKIALFCNVEARAVIEERDKEFSIYEVPLSLVENELDELIVEKLSLDAPSRSTSATGSDMLHRAYEPAATRSRIAVVGKYIKHHDAYKSIYESLDHAGIAHDRRRSASARSRPRRSNAKAAEQLLSGVDGILVPGGFG